MKVLVLDNYDSFTWNLVQYLGELGADVVVHRNDGAEPDVLLAAGFERLVISPGPCTPDEAGISLELSRRFPEAGIPTLGVCLGHQAIAQAFGGTVIRGEPIHGKADTVEHDGECVYRGLESPLAVGRYHSLIVDPDRHGDAEIVATSPSGVVMGIRHPVLPVEGVQFHPESILTNQGHALLSNFLSPDVYSRRGVVDG